MKIELDNALCKKYPELYGQRHMPMSQTAMCWGFQVGTGWYKIIDELSAALTAIRKASGIRMQVTTLKEKYGTLRVYLGNEDRCPGRPNPCDSKLSKVYNELLWKVYNWKHRVRWKYYDLKAKLFPKYTKARQEQNNIWNDIIDAVVHDAERKSAQTCEECGDYGKMNKGSWVMVRCAKHWEGPGTFEDPDRIEDDDELGEPQESTKEKHA